jgi:type VI secretion system secreted protein Hcp
VRNQGQRPVDYFTLTLNDVLVDAYSTGTSNQENRVTENFTFNFASFAFSFLPLKADGTPKQAVVTKFDILANKLL